MKVRGGERTFNFINNLILIIIGIICLYPIWFVLIASISAPGAINAGEVIFLPKGLNIDAYKGLLEKKSIWIGYRNTIFYTILGTVINLGVQIPCAYALSRSTLPGRSVINTMLVITMYFSGGMVPSFLLVNALGMYDTVWALVLPGAVRAYSIIVARSFFMSNVPESLYDSARIDGCGYTRFFMQIVLPLSKSIVAILSMFSIQTHWNSYMQPKIYLYSKNKFTLQQIVQQISAGLDSTLTALEGEDLVAFIAKFQEQQLMKYAVVVVSAAPLVLVYPLVQKYLIRGVMVGAVKG